MRPLVAFIDLAAVQHNYALAKRCAPGREAFAVVKANAYGHGVEAVVEALADQADGFAVAYLQEAVAVRAHHASARILLLQGCFSAEEYRLACDMRLDVVVQGAEQAQMLLDHPLPAKLNVWMKFDTGMHRLGFAEAELREWHAVLKASENVAELNLISHFACADLRGHPQNEAQLETFLSVLDLDFDQRSLANSAAITTIPAAHLDWLRPGIMLYGASPFVDWTAQDLGLKPVMSLQAQVMALREVPAGETVGYAATWEALRPSRIATISCGYADGYPRHAPSGTPVLVNGQRVPLVGRVSMDMLAVDVTDLAGVEIGAAVELWGANLSVDEVAQACGSIGYELLSKVTARVPRRYLAANQA